MREFDFIKINNVLKIKYDYFQKDFDKIKNGSTVKGILKNISDKNERSNLQLDLYWACCNEVAENLPDDFFSNDKIQVKITKEIVDEQIKIALKFYDFFMIVDNTVHVKTKSISFDNLKHIEACGYFDKAFPALASMIEISTQDLIKTAKDKMGI